jgi:HK97 gp10 family phage protein
MAKTQGLDRLKAKLARLPSEVKSQMLVTLNQNADELVAMQKRLAPVRHGHLRDSIEKVEGRHELAVTVQAGGKKAPYARWVEFGTVKMRAEPYFFPAYRALRKRMKSRATRASKKAAQKVAAGGQ